MFKNIFKKVTSLVEVQGQSTNELVAEIHDSFNTASDKALEEAKCILADIQISKKGELLSELGFTSTKESVKNTEQIKEKQQKENLSKIIQEYSQAYPLYKFITESQVQEICKKYGLVMGDIGRYKGDVPDKNLLEIKAFNDWKKNIRDEHIEVAVYYRDYFDDLKHTSYRKSEYHNNSYYNSDCNYRVQEENQYSICAPIKDMNVKRSELKDGWKLQNIPDPVVLYPVYNGYLIVSQWGLEANDPLLVNNIKN